MTRATVGPSDALNAYVRDVSLREHPVLADVRARTAGMPRAGMQVSPEQGQFLALLVGLTGARRIVEVGTFTGYSSTAMALALPDDGHLTACDLSEEWTALAREAWQAAGVAHKVTLRLGPALDTLDALIAQGGAGTWDLVFIDADKENYEAYFDRALTLLRPGGLAMVDNVLWSGRVVDPANTEASTEAIRAFNAQRRGDERVDISLVPIGDGITLARKR